jgi:membrane-associated protease RseP (regulator of RpoE activity)
MNSTASWNFTLFNFPVRVHFSFFLIALLLGLGLGSILNLIIWVVIVFASVLIHELGHAFVSNSYGRSPQIELYSMGGLTVSTRYSLLPYPKEIFISFAGPLAGFILGGIMILVNRYLGPFPNIYVNFLVQQLIWVNIGWGILNLIPIIPLDGGSIMRNIYHWLRNPYDEQTPLKVSIAFGILAVVAALVWLHSIYLAILAGWMIFNNFTALRQGYWKDTFI